MKFPLSKWIWSNLYVKSKYKYWRVSEAAAMRGELTVWATRVHIDERDGNWRDEMKQRDKRVYKTERAHRMKLWKVGWNHELPTSAQIENRYLMEMISIKVAVQYLEWLRSPILHHMKGIEECFVPKKGVSHWETVSEGHTVLRMHKTSICKK